jgi:hypothetical protein
MAVMSLPWRMNESEDHVDLILDAEAEVVLVFLREEADRHRSWKIDTLLGRDLAVVHASDTESYRSQFRELEKIEHHHPRRWYDLLNHLGDILVVDVPRAKEVLVSITTIMGSSVSTAVALRSS